MLKQWTAKQHEAHENKIIAQANIWLQKYSAEQTAMNIWNKYGYMSGTKNGKVFFKGHKGTTEVN